jgi:hypothetical protein
MTQFIYDPWGAGPQPVTTNVETSEKQTHSRLLDASGKPMQYNPPLRLGFDLTPRKSQ